MTASASGSMRVVSIRTIASIPGSPARMPSTFPNISGRVSICAVTSIGLRATPKLGISPWAIAVTQGNRFVGGDMDSGGFASSNAKTWQRTPFTDSRGGRMVMEYAVDPTDAADVLMTSVGIERSTDGGKTWHLALNSKVMFGPVAWAQKQSKIAYAVGFDRSFWRSDDGGQTWKQVS